MDFDEFFTAYLVCALWSSTDADGTPLDTQHDVEDFSDEFRTASREECLDFFKANKGLLEEAHRTFGYSSASAGHDFWLTRNRHGAGFWDRGMGSVGLALSEAAKVYGGVDLSVGDDGEIY